MEPVRSQSGDERNEVIQIGRAEHVHATWTQDPTNLREMSDRILDVFEHIVRHAGIERGVGEWIGPRVEHAHLFQGVVGPHSWIDIHPGQTSEGRQIAGGRVRWTGADLQNVGPGRDQCGAHGVELSRSVDPPA
jgi:hypothetical protein